MEVYFGRHARQQMYARAISVEEVRAIVDAPACIEPGRDQIRKYYGSVGGRALSVVAHDVEPAFVVTVMIEDGEDA